jgi:hypothetical protein
MGIDPAAQLLAQKRVDGAVTLRKAVRQKLEEESAENRKAYERFHNSLALFSSGTIAVSITYLGYLKTIPNKTVMYPKILIGSWVVLLVCLVASLFYTFLNAHYMHFARVREYVEKSIDQKETQVEELDNLLIVNLTDPIERQATKARFAQEAKDYGKTGEWAKKREEIYGALWIWSGRVARFAFPLGICLLMFFAIKNM